MNGGIHNLTDLKKILLDELYNIHNIGQMRVLEVKNKLKEYGITLKTEQELYEEEKDFFFVIDEDEEGILPFPQKYKCENGVMPYVQNCKNKLMYNKKLDESSNGVENQSILDSELQEAKAKSILEDSKEKKVSLEEKREDFERKIAKAKLLLAEYIKLVESDRENSDNDKDIFK